MCVLAWGVVASLQSTVSSFKQLLALRACLGVTEAAFGPGVRSVVSHRTSTEINGVLGPFLYDVLLS